MGLCWTSQVAGPKKTPGPKGDFCHTKVAICWKTPKIAIFCPLRKFPKKKTAHPTKKGQTTTPGKMFFPKGQKMFGSFFRWNIFFPNQLMNPLPTAWCFRVTHDILVAPMQKTHRATPSAHMAPRSFLQWSEPLPAGKRRSSPWLFSHSPDRQMSQFCGDIMIWWYKVSDSKRVSTCSICSSCYIYSKYTDYIFYVFCI